ncbi:MAG: acetyltransferase [Betaproteobacteria bacterium]|nr:acetyltransferase [Betaproteobacteria bacterium]
MLYDAFNGDADGICALLQLRLAEPADSVLVTGVKRDIGLLERVPARAGDQVTALDIAVERNREALDRLLAAGAKVRWFDHHNSGALPTHANFEPHIDLAADICTSLIVDRLLDGAQRPWAVVAAFGDNMADSARRAAEPLGLDAAELGQLRELGERINYNAYGETVADLHFPPDTLYRRLHDYREPFAFIREAPEYRTLKQGYAEDMARAFDVVPFTVKHGAAVYMLPDAAWARRVSGAFANELAQAHPQRAHALISLGHHGDYVVSVRSPLDTRQGADVLCRQFESGGGRAAAAGINRLPEAELERFIQAFYAAFT